MFAPTSAITTLGEFLRFAGKVPPGTSVAELRAIAELFRPIINSPHPEPIAPMAAIHDDVVIVDDPPTRPDGPRRRITADVFVPLSTPGPGKAPVCVFVHGGGWITGSSKTYRKLAARLASFGLVVISVNYRLAPETTWPGPVLDVVSAMRFAVEQAEKYGADPARLVLAGDSCGANLAASAAIMARASKQADPKALALFYGIYFISKLLSDFANVPGGGYLSASGVKLMVESYVELDDRPQAFRAPTLSPIYGVKLLPPTLLLCGSADPLHSQSVALADGLKHAGTSHALITVPDMPHGFCQVEFHPQAVTTIEKAAKFLFRHC